MSKFLPIKIQVKSILNITLEINLNNLICVMSFTYNKLITFLKQFTRYCIDMNEKIQYVNNKST